MQSVGTIREHSEMALPFSHFWEKGLGDDGAGLPSLNPTLEQTPETDLI